MLSSVLRLHLPIGNSFTFFVWSRGGIDFIVLKDIVKYVYSFVDSVAIDESNRLIVRRSHEIISIEEVNRQCAAIVPHRHLRNEVTLVKTVLYSTRN